MLTAYPMYLEKALCGGHIEAGTLHMFPTYTESQLTKIARNSNFEISTAAQINHDFQRNNVRSQKLQKMAEIPFMWHGRMIGGSKAKTASWRPETRQLDVSALRRIRNFTRAAPGPNVRFEKCVSDPKPEFLMPKSDLARREHFCMKPWWRDSLANAWIVDLVMFQPW